MPGGIVEIVLADSVTNWLSWAPISVGAPPEPPVDRPATSPTPFPYSSMWRSSHPCASRDRPAPETTPPNGGSKLTVTSTLKPDSKSAEAFVGGIVYIVSGLTIAIETGEPLTVG